MSKINLVISGGGARAIYALGVVQWLQEQQIKIDKISCVSGGSIVGAMLAQNQKPTDILASLKSIKYKKEIKLVLSKGLFSLDRFEPILDELLEHKTIQESVKPLLIWAISLENGKSNYFKTAKISDAILASCSLYPIFRPYMIDGKYYLDGGFVNNLPAEPFVGDGNKILGINLNPRLDINIDKLSIKRVLYTMFYANMDCRKHLCDIYLEPQAIASYGIFGTDKFDEIFELGYNEARNSKLCVE